MRRFSAAFAVVVSCLVLVACGGHSSTHSALPHKPVGLSSCPGYVTQWGCSAHSPTFGQPPLGLTLIAPTSSATLSMFDSVTVSVLPHGAPAYGGYLFGNFPTYRVLLTAFPSARHVPIAPQAIPVYPTTARMACLDVEPKDATPAQAGPWVAGEIKLGVKPCVYSSLRNGMAEVESVLAHWLGAGWRSKVLLWDANWTGSPHLDAGFDATQWTDHFQGLNVDASLVTDAFLGIKPAPQLPVCIHKRETRSQCSAAKRKIASAQRAAASSERAYRARGCVVLAQRVEWFGDHLKHHPNVKTGSRKRALAASRRAYSTRSCRVFLNRTSFFNEQVIKTRDAN